MLNPFMVIFIQSDSRTRSILQVFHLIFLGQARPTQIHPGHQNPLQADRLNTLKFVHTPPPPPPPPSGGEKEVLSKAKH